jgi:hypothetical protein
MSSKVITADHITTRLIQFKMAVDQQKLFTVHVKFRVETIADSECPVGSRPHIDRSWLRHNNEIITTNSAEFCLELVRKLKNMSNVQLLALAVQLGWVVDLATKEKEFDAVHRLATLISIKHKLVDPSITTTEKTVSWIQ